MKRFFIIVFIFILTLLFIPTHKSNAELNYILTKNIEHLFTHCLIAYPDIAFNKNNYMSKHYNNDCITSAEFLNILQSLYNNNYVLVNINNCFEVKNNIAIKKMVKVPLGKKPIVLSFDDVNYDTKKKGRGMVDKIIINSNGDIATETDINGIKDIRTDLEFVCILENFIKKNPDFSINNARGTINLTGYDGILCYRTSHNNTTNQKEEINNAKKVVNKLKELGWTFASHSYGHYHMKNISVDKFENELLNWKNEVESIVGQTQVYVYPYGEWQVFNNGQICEKHNLLNKYGFNLFCGVGMKSYYSYLPNKNGHKVLFMDRKCIDGTTLRANSTELNKFFNPLEILDSARKNI